MSSKDEQLPEGSLTYNKKDEEIVKKDFWKKIKRTAGKIPFTKEAVAMYYCAIDSKTPMWAKGIAFGALAYFISPIDVLPDAIMGLGFTDDAAIIAAAVKAIGSNVKAEHIDKSDKFFNGNEE